MAKATTTLSTAMTATDTVMVVASATSIAVGRIVFIDQEEMQVAQSWVSGTTVPVLRGREGSAAVAHVVTANVTHGLASDFATPGAQSVSVMLTQRPVLCVSVTATSTLALPPPGCDLRVIINGTAAITLTVPVPTKDIDFCRLTITQNGAAAHTTTFTGGLSGAGTSYDVLTTNATAPTSVQAIACNGLWNAICAPAMGGTVTNLIGSIA